MSTELPFRLIGRKVWVAGHRGMVGQALCRRLVKEDCHVLTATREELDLTRQLDVELWMEKHQPDVIILAAAIVGGIKANSSFPATFLSDNLAMEVNVIRSAHQQGVKKLLLLGSSCTYPRAAPQPMSEESLLTGAFEPSNEWYAMAKAAGLKLCVAYRQQYGDDFITIMPTNLYGVGDNFHLEHSHVPAALMRRFHEAKIHNLPNVTIWGTGEVLREFLYLEDLADGCIHVLKHYSGLSCLNIGTGMDISIKEFSYLMKEITGYKGALIFDSTKPEGMPRKLLDVSKLNALGWCAQTSLRQGLTSTYQWFTEQWEQGTLPERDIQVYQSRF